MALIPKRFAPEGGFEMPAAQRPRGMGPQGPVGMAMKLLLGSNETSAVIGQKGATSREIGEQTGCKLHFSQRNEFYPGTQLQELTIRGETADGVTTALLTAVARVVEATGKVCGMDGDIEEGNARVRVVIPNASCRALIGKGGENIKVLRSEHGIKVHIEAAIGHGEIAEQVVVISGSFDGVQGPCPTLWRGSWRSPKRHGSRLGS
jgi:polyribonucleotide nucleotidyltransferase